MATLTGLAIFFGSTVLGTVLGMVISTYCQLRVVQEDINKLELLIRDLSKTRVVKKPKETQNVLIDTKWKYIDDDPFKEDFIYTIVDVKYNDDDKLYIKYKYGSDCYETTSYEKFEKYHKQID